ncbi:MAG: LamG domain-containing protein, partial [Thermoguttaceae bacterium]|nr:LamG domain-containing protein [Thermoguttaceae bacterium]
MRITRLFSATLVLAALSTSFLHADPVVPDLIAYWDFNQTSGTQLPAIVGGFDGTLGGTWPGDDSQWVESTLGLGHTLSFKGGWADMGQLAFDNPLNTDGPLTIAAWIQPHSHGSGNTAGRILNHRTTSTSHGYEFYLRQTGQLALHGVGGNGYANTPSNVLEVRSTAPWQHVAVTMSEVYQVGGNDRTDVTFYVNGVAVDSQTVSAVRRVTGSTQPTLLLGDSTAFGDAGPGGRGFDGLMDDVGVWGQVMTPAHIATLHSVVHHRGMNYDLGQTQQLFEIHGAGEGSATVGGRTWNYATGLSTNPADLGRVVVADGRYTIALDSSGTGVSAPSHLVAYWNFNQSSGTTLPDVLGNYHGTLAGSWPGDGSGWVAGKDGLGNALDFSSGWVDMGAVPQDNPMNASGALTIAAWIKPD